MDRRTWDRVNELFEAARRMPPGDRDAWVRESAADERVLAETLSLLRAHEDDPWCVGEPVASRPASPSPAPPHRAREPKAGGQFVTYRLIREIAREPSRLIFEAMATGTHAQPRVALHVLSADARDPVVVSLLHAHGDVLASLDHQGIARLLDGGVTGDGTAYLAFEYVAGDPIDRWCQARRLDVRGRVELVVAACAAVQHAHEHLVAHGDLRPANILVSADGQVRLLDCGVRALLGSEAALHHYSSPEQARGDVVTAASDVYSLGILLYTLATGYPPYEVSGQTTASARHVICETIPDVPSTIVGGRDRRTLAGTLDRIILKALRKQPGERYPTAAALSADLCAWRDGGAASVSRTGTWPRLAGRRGGSAIGRGAAAAAAVAMLAGAGALGWQAYQWRGERDLARASVFRTEPRASAANLESGGRPENIADLRLEVAAMTSDLALARLRAGDAAAAEALWTQALSDLGPVLDADPVDVRAAERAALARTALGAICRGQRRLQEALTHCRQALRARERAAASAGAPPDAPVALAAARVDVARLLLDLAEEARPSGPNDTAGLREAGALLAQADSVLRGAAQAPAQLDASADLDRQSERLRRLTRPAR